jgi:hypothetical protein
MAKSFLSYLNPGVGCFLPKPANSAKPMAEEKPPGARVVSHNSSPTFFESF